MYVVAKKNGYDFALPSDNFKIVDSSPNPVIGNKRDYMFLQIYECFNVTGKFGRQVNFLNGDNINSFSLEMICYISISSIL